MQKPKQRALITGITGQDGAYLARFLLKKNYSVSGVIRRSSTFNTQRIDDLHSNPSLKKNFKLFYGDLTDETSIQNIIKKVRPNEIYNLAAQSHVQVSFENPIYTANTAALGTIRILEALRTLNIKAKFYQASTSEMFGNSPAPQSEKTRFQPNSPYAAAKQYAHEITRIYREGFKIFACSGILFNHESETRGGTFVTKKIAAGLTRIKLGKQKILTLGNLYAKRDWGYAPDYVEAMWKIMQQKTPDDFVIATGNTFTVKDFIKEACNALNLNIVFKGKGIKEVGIINNNKVIVVDKKYFRPLEVENLRGNALKAKKILKWTAKTKFKTLVKKMITHELEVENSYD
jgi:GDPmannose 4,6-dehydratase